MECYVHPGSTAVGSCVACGHFVCDICRVNVTGKVFCKGCVERGAHAPRQSPPLFSGGPLTRSRTDKVFGGICASVGRQFGLETNIVRILWLVLALLFVFVPAVVYIVFWCVLPLEDDPGWR